jgi:hypothetical protein
MLRISTVLLLLLILLIFCSVAAAREGNREDEQTCKGGDDDVQQDCPLWGNADFYGMGVRLGICRFITRPRGLALTSTDLQWITSWLANNFIPEEIIISLETNAIFLLAIFSTVFIYSIQTQHIRVIDVLIIHQLCMGFIFSIMSLWGFRTSELIARFGRLD